MKVNVIKAKDKWAQSYGSLDWHDHINGMSARDVEIEMEYVFEQVTAKMLDFINRISGEMLRNDFVLDEKWYEQAQQLIKEATELK